MHPNLNPVFKMALSSAQLHMVPVALLSVLGITVATGTVHFGKAALVLQTHCYGLRNPKDSHIWQVTAAAFDQFIICYGNIIKEFIYYTRNECY